MEADAPKIHLHGWLLLDKPVGIGSTPCVSAVKRALRNSGYAKVKVGHGGTLDPLASGVLPIAIGEATKLAGRMLDAAKCYDFTIGFGTETDTLDAEGAVGGEALGFGIVDVRDVADLHVRALKAPNMAGERFIASGRFMKLREIADLLRAELGHDPGQGADKVTTRNVPDWLVRIAAVFNPLAKAVVGELGNVRNQDASHAKAVLGWATRPVEQSILDSARSLIGLGLVKI